MTSLLINNLSTTMGELANKTLDKMSFKVNIPFLVSIVLATCTIYGAFVSLKSEITVLAVKLDNHITAPTTVESRFGVISKDIEDIKKDNKATNQLFTDIDRRVYILEKYRD